MHRRTEKNGIVRVEVWHERTGRWITVFAGPQRQLPEGVVIVGCAS